MLYDVKRVFYRNNRNTLVLSAVTLKEAQAHCSDPETSSSTCTSAVGKARTRRSGPWFDYYVAR